MLTYNNIRIEESCLRGCNVLMEPNNFVRVMAYLALVNKHHGKELKERLTI